MNKIGGPRSQPQSRSYLAALWHRREFAIALAFGNLKARHAATSLGIVWWVLNPLLFGAVYFLVFGLIFGGARRSVDYLPYLLSGLFAFNYTTASMTGAVNSILSNDKLLVNLQFPRLILPLAALVEAAVGFMASMVAYYVIVAPTLGVYPTLQTLMLPAIFVLHTGFNLGLAAVAARLVIPFRDVKNLIPIAVRLWFYLSPVLWPIAFLDNIPHAMQLVVKANPIFPLLVLYRSALVGAPIEVENLAFATVWAVVLGTVGVILFVRHEDQIARYL